MSQDQDREWVRGSELRRFERNQFFHGKLMTARDMQAEQAYHAGRLNTQSHHVVGAGIVSGLAITDIVDAGDGIEVTLEPGFALDGSGRPIVVDGTSTVSLSIPAGDSFHLYLAFKETGKDRVPIPGAERTTEADCTYNRTLETFELYAESDPPEHAKSVPDVEFPGGSELDADEEYGLVELARAYHQHVGERETIGVDGDVYLGGFVRDSGDWVEASTSVNRPYVYTNDMLFAAIARHIADFENPHEVSVEAVSDEIIERVENLEATEGFVDRLDDLDERLNRIESERDSLERYVMSESLDSKMSAFRHVANEFRSGTAEGIVERTQREIQRGATREQEDYLEFTQSILSQERVLVHELDGAATTDSLDRYNGAVSQLEEVVSERGGSKSISDIANAQSTVCNAALMLRRR